MVSRQKAQTNLRRRAALGGIAGLALAGCDTDTPAGGPVAAPSPPGAAPSLAAPSPEPTTPPAPTAAPEPEPLVPTGDAHFGVNEGFNAAIHARQLGARWTRWIVEWSEVQRYGPGTFNSDDDKNTYNIDAEVLRQDIRHGFKVMAVLKSTPEWAQVDPTKAVRSVPRGLDLAIDDPNNAWATFVR